MRRGRAFTWAPREFPEKLRYAVDLRTTIKHGIINTALTRFANVTPSFAGGNVMAPGKMRAWPLTRVGEPTHPMRTSSSPMYTFARPLARRSEWKLVSEVRDKSTAF